MKAISKIESGKRMGFRFEIKKVIQEVGFLCRLSGNNRIDIMKLLKLLYLVDRESLKEAGYPITGDTHVAMKYGPVLSRVYDLAKGRPDWPYKNQDELVWGEHFKTECLYDLCLIKDPGEDEMSPYEIELIKKIFDTYRHMSQFELRDLTHSFPEWIKNDPGESSKPIPLEDILDAVGLSEDKEEILDALSEEEYYDRFFAGKA